MLDTFKQVQASQYEAVFCMQNTCIDRCPDAFWNAPVVNLKFCQAVFHTLFYADLYLGPDLESFREQAFHRDNRDFFGDYEELEDRAPVSLYDKAPIKTYLEHCRGKASHVIAAECADTLGARSGFEHLACTRAEAHIHNIRHIHHHAAQLSLRLRIDHNVDIPWVKSGWRDV